MTERTGRRANAGGNDDALIEVTGLKKYFLEDDNIIVRLHPNLKVKEVRAVDEVDMRIERGETRGLVGESGCGKSTFARLILRLLEPTGGSIYIDGEDITAISKSDMKRFRSKIQLIFQDPFSSLNPRYRIRKTLTEPMSIHGIGATKEERNRRAADLIEQVGLDSEYLDRYPHEFSGGQRQRIGIARALAVEPKILVADEPTSALDVSNQADILNLLDKLQEERELTILFISHDLSVVRYIADNISVMYLGQIVETAGSKALFTDPKHPYTQSLLSSVPSPDPKNKSEFIALKGDVPSPIDPPSGCRFHTRCPMVIQPEDLSLDQETWRSVFQFKKRVQNDKIVVDHVASRVDENGYDAYVQEEVHPALPAEVHDTCRTAVERLTEGSKSACMSVLDETFTSPCETDEPIVRDVESHEVKCHLYDPEQPGEPTEIDGVSEVDAESLTSDEIRS